MSGSATAGCCSCEPIPARARRWCSTRTTGTFAFKGACTRGIYDNMKTAVDTVFVSRERAYNRRFLQMCGHYLLEPVACTPAAGWEKGQVENQVGTVRQRFFSPRLRAKSYEELNAWLLDRCIAHARAQPHPEIRDKTVWEMFEAERPSLVPYRGPFDGFHAVQASVSRTCLVRFDTNKYSVSAAAVGRPVEVRAYAERIEIRQDGRIVGAHRRAFGRGAHGTTCRCWRGSRARSGMVRPSRTGSCRPHSSASGASFGPCRNSTPIDNLKRDAPGLDGRLAARL
jgi:hypothetical protein